MKLLSKEPTPEMLSIISNEKEVFPSAESLYAALYDAATEVNGHQVLAAHIRYRDEDGRLALVHGRNDYGRDAGFARVSSVCNRPGWRHILIGETSYDG